MMRKLILFFIAIIFTASCENGKINKFNQNMISGVYVPDKISIFMESVNAPDGTVISHGNIWDLSFIVYKNDKIYLGDVFDSCLNTNISGYQVYKKLPDKCQFTFYYNDENHVCSNKGCKQIDYEYIIDMEDGTEYPESFD